MLYHAFHHHNLHLSITLTTCICLSHSPPAPDYIHTHHLHLSTFTHRASIKLLSTVVFWEFLNVHSKHFHAWVSVWFNMAQRTGEPRVLRSRSSRVIPPSSSQTEDTDIRAPLGMSAPATDARSDKQDFLDSILSSMQEQQRLMTFLIERQQQQLTAQTHPAVPSPSAQLAQLSPLARRVELPILADPQTLDLSAFVNWKSRWQDYLRLTRIETELTDAPLQQAFLRTALDPAWVSVWNAGLLGIQHGHLFPDIVQRLGDYLRKKHNPLVSRKEFYARSQQECHAPHMPLTIHAPPALHRTD